MVGKIQPNSGSKYVDRIQMLSNNRRISSRSCSQMVRRSKRLDRKLGRISAGISTKICLISQKEYLVPQIQKLQTSRKDYRCICLGISGKLEESRPTGHDATRQCPSRLYVWTKPTNISNAIWT